MTLEYHLNLRNTPVESLSVIGFDLLVLFSSFFNTVPFRCGQSNISKGPGTYNLDSDLRNVLNMYLDACRLLQRPTQLSFCCEALWSLTEPRL